MTAKTKGAKDAAGEGNDKGKTAATPAPKKKPARKGNKTDRK